MSEWHPIDDYEYYLFDSDVVVITDFVEQKIAIWEFIYEDKDDNPIGGWTDGSEPLNIKPTHFRKINDSDVVPDSLIIEYKAQTK